MSLVTDIQELCDESAGAVFWPAAQVYDAANEAIIESFASSRHEFKLSTMTASAGDDLVALPADIMIPQYILGTAGKYWPTTQAKLEQQSRAWRGEPAGVAKFFVLWDISTLRVWPRGEQDYAYDLCGVPWPSVGEIAASNLDISVPKLLKQAITHRAAACLLGATQPLLADSLVQEAQELEYKFRVQLRNRNSHNIRRVRPGTLFTRAQSGSIPIGKKYY